MNDRHDVIRVREKQREVSPISQGRPPGSPGLGALGPGVTESGISEEFPLYGFRSLYGATKLASELMLLEYINAFHINGFVNRCGVIAGPWQSDR